MNSDFKELLKLFNDNAIKYLIIGDWAVTYHAEPRYTKDLDVWISTERTNAQAVFAALRAFGAPLSGMSADDFSQPGTFYQMGVPPVRVDVLMSVPGLEFEDAWSNRVAADFDGVPVNFISKADLIVSKRASGRPQDLIDADLLKQVG